MRNIYLSIAVLFFFCGSIVAQEEGAEEGDVVQLSGFVFTQEGENILPVPLVTIAVMNTTRGTYSFETGFFTIVVREGEELVFSSLGYKTVHYIVPDTVEGDWLTVAQVLERDTVNLPEIIVRPWPSRENFRVEFLAMEIDNELQDRALENLRPYTLNKIRNELPRSGSEIAQIYFNEQAIQNYSAGQFKPMPIFDPIAWSKFIKAVKNGDYKKKKK